MIEKLIPELEKDIPLKEQLINFSYSSIPLIKNEPIFNILKNSVKIANNIENIFNKLNYRILNNKQKNRNLAKYFNIYLFIIKNPELINSLTLMKLILEMNDYYNKINNDYDIHKKTIISKIIIELMDIYYENIKNNNINDNTLEKIKTDNIIFFEKNYSHLIKLKKNFKKENILSLKMEKIYRKSILVIIKKYNFKKDENAYYNMAFQYELDSIIFSESIMKKVFDTLISKEYYFKKNIINDKEDIFKINKINFYFILFKYILKNSIYIYQIPFLIKTRKTVLNFIKTGLNEIFSYKINNNIKDKLCFVINIITDTKYYFSKFMNHLKLKEIYDYYKEFCFLSKKKEILFIENNIINNNAKIDNINKNIMNDFHIAKRMNERISIIKYLFFVNNKKELENYISDWEKIEKKINEKKFEKLEHHSKLQLSNYFTNENNKMELMKIFKKDIYNYTKEKCKDFLNKEKNNLKESVINDSKMKNNSEESKTTSILIESNYIYNSSLFEEQNFSVKNKKSELKFEKILGKHEKSAEFIKEVDPNILVSGGSDKKLFFYDNHFNLIFDIKDKDKSIINNIIKSDKNKLKDVALIYSTNDKLTIIEINKKYRYDIINLPNNYSKSNGYLNLLEFKGDHHLVLTEQGVDLYFNLFSKIIGSHKNTILNNICKGAIKINEEKIVFTSNITFPNGEDKLIIYNVGSKKIEAEISGYSFVKTVNGLSLFQKSDNLGSLLLCACAQYKSDQKNGILVVNIGGNGEKKMDQFYDTDNYEVYCFCLITVKENNYILNDEKNKKYDTECFLVGGFDQEKKSGIVKLYKFEKDEEISEIKFINCIDLEDILEVKSPITCIHQFQSTDNLLITTLDGNVYLYKFDLNYIISVNAENDIEIAI